MLALTSASRASELTNLIIRNMLPVSPPINRQKPGASIGPNPKFKVFLNFQKTRICVCNTLEIYSLRRKSWGVNEPHVLVSFVKSYKVMSFSMVSRWLKQILEMTGNDTDILKDIQLVQPRPLRQMSLRRLFLMS